MNKSLRRSWIGQHFLLKMLMVTILGMLAASLAYATCGTCHMDVSTCWKQSFTQSFRCCVDNDGDQVYHCADCLRTMYLCGEGQIGWGDPFNCTNPGEVCTP